MHQAEIIVLLLTAVGVLALLAQRITLPYPIVLVLGGLALSFVPRLPAVNLNPDVVFYFILPPLIYPAALFTSWRDFRRNLRPILLLAIGLVLATMLAVAWIAHSIVPALPWEAAFALGAIVSPPDAVAATAIIRRLGVPHRIQVILEGESLVNDASALVALQFAIAARVTGTFSPAYAAGRFVWAAAGGIGIGLLVGVFLQAEDGIRDLTVTGVQTCALPIWPAWPRPTSARPRHRVAGPAHHRRVHTAARGGPRRRGARGHGTGARPVLHGHESGLGDEACRRRARRGAGHRGQLAGGAPFGWPRSRH